MMCGRKKLEEAFVTGVGTCASTVVCSVVLATGMPYLLRFVNLHCTVLHRTGPFHSYQILRRALGVWFYLSAENT